jgi:hypothetical protein
MKQKINNYRNRMRRKKEMRQKYMISRDSDNNKLKIREYAIIDQDLRRVSSSIPTEASYSYLCEETYESEAIMSSISKGMSALVANLRTHNIFPIEPYVTKIAESVMAIYTSSDYGSVELLFDDKDLVSV